MLTLWHQKSPSDDLRAAKEQVGSFSTEWPIFACIGSRWPMQLWERSNLSRSQLGVSRPYPIRQARQPQFAPQPPFTTFSASLAFPKCRCGHELLQRPTMLQITLNRAALQIPTAAATRRPAVLAPRIRNHGIC